MATKKISALVELTTPAVGDLLVITDVSESADADKTKKITYANIANLAAQIAALPTITTYVATDLLIAIRGGVAYQVGRDVGKILLPTTAQYRIQSGSVSVNPGGSWDLTSQAVTYPVAFSAAAISVMVSVGGSGKAGAMVVFNVAGTGFTVGAWKPAADTSAITVNWSAIGPA